MAQSAIPSAGTTAFVLGGGGLLGAAEVGMLQALVTAGIAPSLVLGSSVGALNGAAIAADPSVQTVDRLAETWTALGTADVFASSLFGQMRTLARSRTHLHDNTRLRALIDAQSAGLVIEDLAVPFQRVAVSIETARARWFDRGPVTAAVLASCAVPGLLPPVLIDGEHYLDGGLVDSLPLGRAVALGATTIYVLHVGRIERPLEPPKWPWEVGLVAFEVARRHRFVEDLSNVPDGVTVHVLPSGDEGTPLAKLRYRDSRSVKTRIERAHEATAVYLRPPSATWPHRADVNLPVPPWLIRRLLIAPLMPVLAVAALIGLPVVVLGQAICAAAVVVVRRRKVRWRLTRVWAFAIVYLVGETACLVACFVLWVLAGFGWRLQSERQQRWHLRLLGRFLTVLVAVAGFVFRFRLEVEEPVTHPDDTARMATARPLLVLARHAGPGASFVLVHLLLSRYDRRPRIVLKEQLRLDPSFDVLLTRLGCRFIATGEGHRDNAVHAIAETAGALEKNDALLLYPEGGDWTPTRHRLAVSKLRRRGRAAEAARAAGMPHVLPPKPAGTLAALNAAPDADIVVFTHTGHDELLDAVTIWQALPLRARLHLVWWREPAGALASDEKARTDWLLGVWARVDAWIGEQAELSRLTQADASPAPQEPAPAPEPS